MNDDLLKKHIDALITGEITPEEHRDFQQTLKENARARALFRERMDLEAGLHALASEDGFPKLQAVQFTSHAQHTGTLDKPTTSSSTSEFRPANRVRLGYAAVAIAATILLFIGAQIWTQTTNDALERFVKSSVPAFPDEVGVQLVGLIRQQDNCQWDGRPISMSDRFALGQFTLTRGVAEMRFDSGTEITLEAPCEIEVTSRDTARLLAGNVFVNVTELSNGFTLETPEAQIVDEGTEYAVALGEDSTEVHVFDGSVIWIPTKGTDHFEDRVESGEAKSYLRGDPTQVKRIPFGKRQFVQRMEEQVRNQAGDSLLAYDGFENLAGRVRRGRSGFGWADSWQSNGRGRGPVANIVDAPSGVVFGMDRTQRRLMSLSNGDDVSRQLDSALELEADLYVSFLAQRTSQGGEQSLQISLEPDLPGRGRRRHRHASFGVATDGFPYINSGNIISRTALGVPEGQASFYVFKLSRRNQSTQSFLRVYLAEEAIDQQEPLVWTTIDEGSWPGYGVEFIRFSCGPSAVWEIDELRIGTSWTSVIEVADSR